MPFDQMGRDADIWVAYHVTREPLGKHMGNKEKIPPSVSTRLASQETGQWYVARSEHCLAEGLWGTGSLSWPFMNHSGNANKSSNPKIMIPFLKHISLGGWASESMHVLTLHVPVVVTMLPGVEVDRWEEKGNLNAHAPSMLLLSLNLVCGRDFSLCTVELLWLCGGFSSRVSPKLEFSLFAILIQPALSFFSRNFTWN